MVNNNRLDLFERALVALLGCFLILPNGVSSTLLILLVILRVFRGQKAAIPKTSSWWMMIPAVVLMASWAFHGLVPDGPRELQLWLTWMAAFLYFYSSPFRQTLTLGFVVSSILVSLLILGYFGFTSPEVVDSYSQAIRNEISLVFRLHPTYLSAALLWAAMLIIQQRKLSIRLQIPAVVLLVFVGTLAGGKMPLIAFCLIAMVVLYQRIETKWIRYASLTLAVLILLSNALFNPAIKDRFAEIINPSTSYEKGQWLTSTELRLGIWDCSIRMIKDHWVVGVGVGNTRSTLENCYQAYEQSEFFTTEFNTHNQFLHFWLAGGVPSLLIMVSALGMLFIRAWKSDNQELIVSLAFFTIICMTENYLSRQAGMMMLSFFIMSSYFEGESGQSGAKSIAS